MSRGWREWIIWPVGIGAMLAGAFGIFAAFHWSFAGHELVDRFGEALLIAGFLSMTVDQYVKKKMLQEVSYDVAKYLIGYELPAEAQDRIKELMGSRIIRENYEVHYLATKVATPDKLRLEVTISYYVKNITNHDEAYQQHLALEKHDSPVIIELSCQSSDVKAAYSQKGKDVFAVHEGVVEAYGPTIKIRSAKKGFTYRISDMHSVIQPEEYSDLISFLAPTINVKVTANFPPGFTFVAPREDVSDQPAADTWEYNRLFMPTEHIRMRWFKNKSS
jgi:hypothetical protein